MANLKSSQKDVRRTARRAARNVTVKSRLKTLQKKFTALSGKNDPALKAAAREYVAALDKSVKAGVIHANKASRHKAQVAKIAKI
jgi:small subunit ribosomal protein S20